jgi:uncharacterized protein YecE (DUF72 family)
MAQGSFHVGTSGWSYIHWGGIFYPAALPASRRFGYYSGRFATVELNTTFYRLPVPEVFEKWAAQAPPGFVYALKANQFITHMKRLREPDEPVQRFTERARLLGEHLGPILYQLPPRFPPDYDRLEHFLSILPRDLSHAVEFRDPRWLNPTVRSMLQEYKVGLCLADMPGRDNPLWATSDTVYVRFHGDEVLYGDSYTSDELALWAARLAFYVAEGRTVYAYFNNDMGAYAVQNALELNQLIADCIK